MATSAPETVETPKTRVSCDGGALGHPLVWLQIDPKVGDVVCGYCGRRFVLKTDAPAHG